MSLVDVGGFTASISRFFLISCRFTLWLALIEFFLWTPCANSAAVQEEWKNVSLQESLRGESYYSGRNESERDGRRGRWGEQTRDGGRIFARDGGRGRRQVQARRVLLESAAMVGREEESGVGHTGVRKRRRQQTNGEWWFTEVKKRVGEADVLHYLKTHGSLRTTTVSRTFEKKSLLLVSLNRDHMDFEQWGVTNLVCNPDECPKFRNCAEDLLGETKDRGTGDKVSIGLENKPHNGASDALRFPTVSGCMFPEVADLELRPVLAPLNCPQRKCRPEEMSPCFADIDGLASSEEKSSGEKAKTCAQIMDRQPFRKFRSEIFELRDVFVNSKGQVFNESVFFDRMGCSSIDDFTYVEGTTVVHEYDTVLNLAHWAAYNFYHGLVELLPAFFALSRIPSIFTSIPITFHLFTVSFLDDTGVAFLGHNVTSLEFRVIPDNELFFARRLIQPLYQTCGVPSPSLWRQYRQHHLIPRDGLPLFDSHWSPRTVAPARFDRRAPPDWIIILAKRFGSRSLNESDSVEQLLRDVFPPHRIVTFDGNMDIEDAKELFNRAIFFVAVHGAAMTNMIFMPFFSVVLELRPRDYENACYHHLAEACDLDYFLQMCDGGFSTSTTCDLSKITRLIVDTIKYKIIALTSHLVP